MSYRDILKRNEKMINSMYEIQDDVQDLANENEILNTENEILYKDNVTLDDENQNMRDDIEDLHRSTRRYGRRYDRNTVNNVEINTTKTATCGYEVKQEESKPQCPLQSKEEKIDRRQISFYFSERTKNIILFTCLIGLILLLGLGIEPGVALNYENILNCYLELFFNLYNMVVLGCIGFILSRIWKKIKK